VHNNNAMKWNIRWAIVWCCLRDPRFSRLSRKPTCDRRPDGRWRHKYRGSIASHW